MRLLEVFHAPYIEFPFYRVSLATFTFQFGSRLLTTIRNTLDSKIQQVLGSESVLHVGLVIIVAVVRYYRKAGCGTLQSAPSSICTRIWNLD